ncbi:hypothetical protein KAX02_07460 [candidate division WOR-3 bacterium]|nr:hypothetical protein [candidate division WOR-3 bacterium]
MGVGMGAGADAGIGGMLGGDLSQGLLAGLKGVSPNITGKTVGNNIELFIPKDDVITAVLKGADERTRNSMKVEFTPDGIKMTVKLF